MKASEPSPVPSDPGQVQQKTRLDRCNLQHAIHILAQLKRRRFETRDATTNQQKSKNLQWSLSHQAFLQRQEEQRQLASAVTGQNAVVGQTKGRQRNGLCSFRN
jgi:hypothetical protein